MRTATLRLLCMVLGVLAVQVSHGAARGENDPTLPDPPPPPVLAYPNGNPIVPSEGVGAIGGVGSVTPSGQYVYRLPIAVPPGRAGMQPSVALQYASGAGEGLLGVGWSLESPSEIRRCHKTWATEGHADGVDYDDTDAFCLDGQKLRQVNAAQKTNGHEGAEYRTERDSFSRIIAHGDTAQGPDSFTVEAKSGLVMAYSQVVLGHRFQGGFPNEPLTDAGHVRAAWLLRTVHDRSGNAMVYDWDVDEDETTRGVQYRLAAIRYTGKLQPNGEVAGDRRKVEFHYDDLSVAERRFRYESGVRWETRSRLTQITLSAPNPASSSEVGHYVLSYEKSPDTGRALLHIVKRCDAANVCLRFKQFDFWHRDAGGQPPQFQDVPVSISNLASNAFPQPVLVADFNGDGLDDILYRITPRGLPDHDAFLSFLHLAQRDANGAVSFGSEILVNPSGSEASCINFGTARAADIDGDGRVELVAGVESDPTNAACVEMGYRIFRWNDPQQSFLPVGDLIDAVPSADLIQLTDFDGDGRIDIFLDKKIIGVDGNPVPGPWQLLRNLSSPAALFAFSSPESATLTALQSRYARAMDVDGDGRGDLLPINPETTNDGTDDIGMIPGATERLALNDDGAPEADTKWALRSFGRSFLADLNGDGLRDVLYPLGADTMVRWNLGNGFGPLTPWASPIVPVSSSAMTPDLGLRPADLDGDGVEDLVSFHNAGDLPQEPKARVYRVRDGQWSQAKLSFPGSPSIQEVDTENDSHADGWPSAMVGDFNGDGLVDFVRADLWRITVEGSQEPYVAFQLRAEIQQPSWSDILLSVTDEDAPGPQQTVLYARTPPGSAASCAWPQLCVRRGLPVVAQTATAAGGPLTAYRYQRYSYEDGRIDLQGRGFLGFGKVSVYDPQLRAQSTTTYDNVTRVELPTGGGFYPYSGVPASVKHVSAIFDAPTDDVEMPPLPAGPLNGRVTTTTYQYNQNTPQTPGALWSNAAIGTYIVHGIAATTIETEAPISIDPDAGMVSVSGPPAADYRQVDVSTAYDAFENPTMTYRSTHAGVTRWTSTTYENRVGDWLIGLPVHSESSAGDAASPVVIRQTNYGVDALGRLWWVTIEPQIAALRRTTVLALNGDGLPYQIEESSNAGSRKGYIAYDDSEGMFPRATWNQLGHADRAVFHPAYGVPVLSEDANGVQLARTYDRFGRLRSVTPDGGTTTTLTYASNHCKMSAVEKGLCVSATFAGGGEQVAYSDEYGRAWELGSLGFDGTMVFQRQRYNVLGQAVRATRPFTDFEQGMTIATFDTLGRPVQIKAPDTTITSFDHLGMFVTAQTDANLHTITARTDKDGRLSELYDAALTPTRYSYGAFDQVVSVEDPQGNFTQLGYDDLGRRTWLVDPDQGTTTFEHNGFGDMRFVRHYSGQDDSIDLETEYRYDLLGRVYRRLDTLKADPNTTEITEYQYDAAPHALGKLVRTSSPDGIETLHRYDDHGRPFTTEWNVDGESFLFTRTYDPLTGRPEKLAYPDGGESFAVAFGYNASGWLESVGRAVVPSVAFWRVLGRNLDGMLTDASFPGPDIGEQRSYSPLTSRLHGITVKGNATLLSMTYGYDLVGNVVSRADGVADRLEEYEYDDADRLVTWNLKYPAPGGHLEQSKVYSYDDVGNITAVWTNGVIDEVHEIAAGSAHRLARVVFPGQSLARRHETDKRGRDTHEWDASPNDNDPPIPEAAERTIEYTPFDLPRLIKRQGDVVQEVKFAYDAFGHRIKKVSAKDGVITTTITLEGLYERREAASIQGTAVHHVFYVHGDGGPVAQVLFDESTKQETITYLAKDGLGSTGVAFDEKGAEVERYFHEPFGGRVDVDGAPLKAFQSVAGVSIGFTGQTEDDDLGLIDMRGRVYDPAQKRFLTPDPTVPDPMNSQAYNRYAYVLNNPLKYVDPSGFDPMRVGPGDMLMPPIRINVKPPGRGASGPGASNPTSDGTGQTPPTGGTSAPVPNKDFIGPPPPPKEPPAKEPPPELSDGDPSIQPPRMFNPYRFPTYLVDNPTGPGTRDPFGVDPTSSRLLIGWPSLLEQLIAGNPGGGRSAFVVQGEQGFFKDLFSLFSPPQEWCFMRPTMDGTTPRERAGQRVAATVSLQVAMFVIPQFGMAAAGAGAAAAQLGARAEGSVVYQLVNEAGEPVYYGITNNPLIRLGQHARLPPGPFNGMQVVSDSLALPQARALETSLIQQANAEGRLIYNVAGTSISPSAPIAVPPTIFPSQTFLNPKLY